MLKVRKVTYYFIFYFYNSFKKKIIISNESLKNFNTFFKSVENIYFDISKEVISLNLKYNFDKTNPLKVDLKECEIEEYFSKLNEIMKKEVSITVNPFCQEDIKEFRMLTKSQKELLSFLFQD